MKNIKYFVLSFLILPLLISAAFAQQKENASQEKILVLKNLTKQEIQTLLNEAKEENIAKNKEIKEISQQTPKEIYFGQRISLQEIVSTENTEKTEGVSFKLNLKPGKNYTLMDLNTNKEVENNSSRFLWNSFLGKYEYSFTFTLVKNTQEPYLYIQVKPVPTKEPTIPYAYMVFNADDKEIRFGAMAYAIDGHSGFGYPLIKIK